MRMILLLTLSILVVTVPALAGKVVKISEEASDLKRLNYSEASDVTGLYHPGMEGYARLAGIDVNRVMAALKLSPTKKGKSPAFIGASKRYKTSGFRSVTAKVFELVRVQIGGRNKVLVLYNNQVLDENNIENFHRGWCLAELSDKYEVEKMSTLFNVSKHVWPGGEAIYTDLKVKKNTVKIAITYEQPIRGFEVHTICAYNFAPDEKGLLAFKGVRDITVDGPME